MCLWVCLFGVGYHVCIDPHQRPSHAPRKGVCCRAKIFGSALLQPARSVCVSRRTFFMLPLLWSFSRYCIKQWTEQWPLCSLTPQLPTDDIHSIMVYSRSYRIAGRQIRCNFTNMVPDNVDCGDGKIFVGMGMKLCRSDGDGEKSMGTLQEWEQSIGWGENNSYWRVTLYVQYYHPITTKQKCTKNNHRILNRKKQTDRS